MKGGKGTLPAAAESTHQLEETTRIGRDNRLTACIEKMSDFAVAELLGRLRLEEVVNACRATAKGGLSNLDNLKLRNSGEKFARLLMDSLSVTEVACVVIGDADR